MPPRHASREEYVTLSTAYEKLTYLSMLKPGLEREKCLADLADFLATERNAAAVRLARSKAEAQRRRRHQQEENPRD